MQLFLLLGFCMQQTEAGAGNALSPITLPLPVGWAFPVSLEMSLVTCLLIDPATKDLLATVLAADVSGSMILGKLIWDCMKAVVGGPTILTVKKLL